MGLLFWFPVHSPHQPWQKQPAPQPKVKQVLPHRAEQFYLSFLAKKKKWSKGKVKDKANNAVLLDKPTYDKLFKEVGSYRFVSVSVLVERLKINGSLARKALRELEAKGIIKPIEKHSAQQIYSNSIFVTFELTLFVARVTAAAE